MNQYIIFLDSSTARCRNITGTSWEPQTARREKDNTGDYLPPATADAALNVLFILIGE
jgi:hypothetical protein